MDYGLLLPAKTINWTLVDDEIATKHRKNGPESVNRKGIVFPNKKNRNELRVGNFNAHTE